MVVLEYSGTDDARSHERKIHKRRLVTNMHHQDLVYLLARIKLTVKAITTFQYFKRADFLIFLVYCIALDVTVTHRLLPRISLRHSSIAVYCISKLTEY